MSLFPCLSSHWPAVQLEGAEMLHPGGGRCAGGAVPLGRVPQVSSVGRHWPAAYGNSAAEGECVPGILRAPCPGASRPLTRRTHVRWSKAS